MGGDEGLIGKPQLGLESGDADGDEMIGTSKFGGAVDGAGDNYDSFDDAFEKPDESQPPEEDFMVKPKPKRPQWGVQSFGVDHDQEEVESNEDAQKKKAVALDIGLDTDTMKDAKMRKFEEFKAR